MGERMKIEPFESEERFDENFEEMIAYHQEEETIIKSDPITSTIENESFKRKEDKDSLMEEMIKEVFQKLFDQVWPKVFKRIEPTVKKFLDDKPTNLESRKFLSTEEDQESDNSTIMGESLSGVFSSNSSSSGGNDFTKNQSIDHYVVDNFSVRKNCHSPTSQLNCRKHHNVIPAIVTLPLPPAAPPALISRNKELQKSRCINTFSARSTKRRGNENRLEPPANQIEINTKPRNGLLPPIETIDINPKIRSVRSTSAFLQYSKKKNIQPRLNSSRSKLGLLSPIENGNPELLISSQKLLDMSNVERGKNNAQKDEKIIRRKS